MRTTIEIPDETRAKLLELAARRGEKGISAIVQEALEGYFQAEERCGRTKRALAVLGTLGDEEGERLMEDALRLRGR